MQDHIRSIGNGAGSLFAGGGTERRLKPHPHHHHHQQGCFKCPRCGSVNTKFCYYNNYNLSQPRFFCKGCRRYWTEGGVLRNVPVGGGTRKTKRSKRKSGDGKAPSVSSSRNSSSEDGSNIVAATISPETTTSEAAPPLLNQCSTDNHQLVSYSSDDQLRFISGPEISPSMVQQDGDRIVEKQKWGEFEWSMSCNGGAAAEDWGLFDESYWLNNPDNQLS